MKKVIPLILISIMVILLPFRNSTSRVTSSPVKDIHLKSINALFKESGIKSGSVGYDRYGRVELKGEYKDEREVDLGFSIAQTVVGVRWVSPVVPENIRVKEWEKKFSDLFGKIKPSKEKEKPLGPIVHYDTLPGPIAEKYALIVGVGRFQETSITPLQYAEKDAKDFYTYLTSPIGGKFKKENVILLTNEQATSSNVKAALDKISNMARPDDLVLIYFSSHGTPPDKFGGVHIVTYDSQPIPRPEIWKTSLTENILKEFIQTVKAKRLIVIMDACYSNGAYKNVQGFLPPGGKSLGAEDEEGFGISKKYMAQRLLGAKDFVIEEEAQESKEAPLDASNGWGKVLISASDEGEKSWESDNLKNSIFTYYFVSGLRKYGSIKDAFDYSKPLVKRSVKAEKGEDVEQNPQLTPSRKEWNFSLSK